MYKITTHLKYSPLACYRHKVLPSLGLHGSLRMSEGVVKMVRLNTKRPLAEKKAFLFLKVVARLLFH